MVLLPHVHVTFVRTVPSNVSHDDTGATTPAEEHVSLFVATVQDCTAPPIIMQHAHASVPVGALPSFEHVGMVDWGLTSS